MYVKNRRRTGNDATLLVMYDYIKLHTCARLVDNWNGPEIFPWTEVGSDFSNLVVDAVDLIDVVYSIDEQLK